MSVAKKSRDKGKRGELELSKFLCRVWPDCKRNLDQFGIDKRDLLDTPGFHFQAKRTEAIRIWEALAQARDEAALGDIPVVAFRRNRSEWHVALRLHDFLDLLQEIDEMSDTIAALHCEKGKHRDPQQYAEILEGLAKITDEDRARAIRQFAEGEGLPHAQDDLRSSDD